MCWRHKIIKRTTNEIGIICSHILNGGDCGIFLASFDFQSSKFFQICLDKFKYVHETSSKKLRDRSQFKIRLFRFHWHYELTKLSPIIKFRIEWLFGIWLSRNTHMSMRWDVESRRVEIWFCTVILFVLYPKTYYSIENS